MGLITSTIVALATLATVPNVQFTSDSKYTSIKCLEITVQENRDEEEEIVSKDLIFKENYVPGYTIYDNPNTPYIDGLKVDDVFVTDWKFENYDDSIAHTIHVKTVFSDDVAGALAAASKGDFSKVMANPIMILQLVYFTLALIGVLASMFVTVRNKIKKNIQDGVYQDKALELAEKICTPIANTAKKQQDTILKAIIIGQSGEPDAQIKMLELLEQNATENVGDLTKDVKNIILNAKNESELIKKNAHDTINKIAEGTYVAEKAANNIGKTVKESIDQIKTIGDDGTSI